MQEFYSDVFSLRINPWGVAVTFALSPLKEGVPGHDLCVVRLSHETAKVLCLMLKRQLKAYEENAEYTITISSKVMTELGLSSEAW
jgi:hypothetical protein